MEFEFGRINLKVNSLASYIAFTLTTSHVRAKRCSSFWVYFQVRHPTEHAVSPAGPAWESPLCPQTFHCGEITDFLGSRKVVQM